MPKLQRFLLTLLVAALLTPSAALGAGPSAGDQQYCDPLTGCSGGSSHHTTTPSGQGNSNVNAAPQGSGTVTRNAAATTSTPPTSSTGANASSASGGKTLPFTGVDSGLLAIIGAGMLGGGLLVRRRAQRR